MKRYTRLLLVSCICSLTGPLVAVAQPPDLLRNYRFVPRYSTLDVSGGFAGFDLELPIYGQFSLVTGYHTLTDKGTVFTDWHRYARFIDVDAQGINPTDFGPYSYDLDESLNLSGLRGVPGPLLLPLENWQFRGLDGQGAPINLLAIEVGRWLVLFGSNDTPCCDYFDYEVQAIARQTPFADFDEDGDSDHDDFRQLENNLGLSEQALLEQGDSDVDGDVDGIDFLNLQRDHGDTAETAMALASSALAAAITAVPEPSSGLLLLLATTCLLRRRRHG